MRNEKTYIWEQHTENLREKKLDDNPECYLKCGLADVIEIAEKTKLSIFNIKPRTNQTRLLVSGRSPECSDCLLRSMEH